MTAKEIEDKILKHMKTLEWPATTEDIAKAVGVTWNTAQIHLKNLQIEGKVKFRRVGRQNQWWEAKNFKEGFK